MSGIAPITGSVSAGPGPTLNAWVNWLSPSTSRKIWSPTSNPPGETPLAVWPASGLAKINSARRRTTILSIMVSFDRHAFRQVARPIHVAAAKHGDVIRQELERNHRQHWRDQGWACRHGDLIIREVTEIAIALARDCDDAATPGFHFLHVRNDLRVDVVLRRQAHDRHVLVDQGDGPMLDLGRRVPLGVDVGDLLELERALERHGEVDAAAEVQSIAGVRVSLSERPHLWLDRERALHQLWELDQLRDQLTPLLLWQPSLTPEVQPEEQQGDDLRREGFGRCDAHLRARVQVDPAVRLARDCRPDDVAETHHRGACG